MLQLKACPRCRGDLVITTSFGEQSTTCLQCGHDVVATVADSRPVATRRAIPVRLARRPRAPRAA
jgi:uncharacterized protein (DUF983 family)